MLECCPLRVEYRSPKQVLSRNSDMTDCLTPREVQCVKLAGDGLSDKEIRRRLGMGSERTVQAHLARAYAKLGVHDRRAAAEALGNEYLELLIRIPEETTPPSYQEAEAVETDYDGDRTPMRSFYDRYVHLGRWRQPPRWGGGRSLLILCAAGLLVLALGGAMALLKVVFEVVELFRHWLG